MRVSKSLPIAAGIAIAGAAMGVQLGRSAIAEIDPLYFAERPVRFHAELAANRSSDWAQVQAAEYQREAPAAGLGSGCIRCVPAPVEYVPERHGAIEYAGWTVYPSEEPAEPALATLAEEAPDPERQWVERYASYAVAAEPLEAAAVEEEAYAAPEPEDYAGTW